MDNPFNNESTKAALLLVEYQNDLSDENGKAFQYQKECLEQIDDDGHNMINRSIELLKQCRKNGIEIVHQKTVLDDSFFCKNDFQYGILAQYKEMECLKKDTWGSDFLESMKPINDEIVLDGKKGVSAFHDTKLDKILKENNISTLIIAGFLTNYSIESTIRSAYDLGYNIISVIDCIAGDNLESHTFTIENNFPMFSLPISYKELIDNMEIVASTEVDV